MKRSVNSRIVLAGIFAVAGLPNLHAERGCSECHSPWRVRILQQWNRSPCQNTSYHSWPRGLRREWTSFEQLHGERQRAVSHNAGSGTYTVNPDCTGTIFTTLGALQLRLDFVIADRGNEINFLIGSNPQILDVYGVRKKQFPNFERECSNADLNGTYGFYSTGTWFRPAHPA